MERSQRCMYSLLTERTMSWSQIQHTEDLYDQITLLVGSTVRLLGGLAGVFVLANAAFDPQSSSEYTFYQLSEAEAALLLDSIREHIQPSPARQFVLEDVPPEVAAQLSIFWPMPEDGETPEKL